MIPGDNKPGIESVKRTPARICTNPVRRSTARESKKGETNGARQSGQSGFLPVQKLPLAGVPRPRPSSPLPSFFPAPHPFRPGFERVHLATGRLVACVSRPERVAFSTPPPCVVDAHATRGGRSNVTRETAYNFLARVSE